MYWSQFHQACKSSFDLAQATLEEKEQDALRLDAREVLPGGLLESSAKFVFVFAVEGTKRTGWY